MGRVSLSNPSILAVILRGSTTIDQNRDHMGRIIPKTEELQKYIPDDRLNIVQGSKGDSSEMQQRIEGAIISKNYYIQEQREREREKIYRRRLVNAGARHVLPAPAMGERDGGLIVGQRLESPDLDLVLAADGGAGAFRGGAALAVFFVSDADEVPALLAEELRPPPEDPPRAFRDEVRHASAFLLLREPALVNGEEGDETLLDRLAVLGAEVGRVPVRGAQIQFVSARSAAASQSREDGESLEKDKYPEVNGAQN